MYCTPPLQNSNAPLLHVSLISSIFRYISNSTEKYIAIHLFSPGIAGILRRTVGGAGGFEERRRGQRYKLALPVQLSDGIGITCDVSTSGIFFETESAHSIGDTIRLSLNFQHETLQCEARVVRVEPRNGQFGVAVELKSYVFC
jgi:PilZ domain